MAAEGEIEDFSYSRDLLRRFAGDETAPEVGGGEFREVELSLGLSLGGCFGDAKEKGLVRSSSVSVFPPENHHAAGGIARTVSMPAETEEEWRRRKEIQSLKRMEAKRKRSEKRAKERREEEEEDLASAAGPPKEAKVAAAVPAAAATAGALRLAGTGKPASQGSIGSQGSSSSGVSDFESKPLHGLDATRMNISVEVRSPPLPLVLEHASNKALSSTVLNKLTNPPKEEDEPSKKRKICTVRSSGVQEMERSMMEEMPCVSTRGDGPNGRRIEGFLYKYRKGEEVRIVCVCHGSFLTPAEFVKHAGGGDVDHPLRHIVVNPNPSALL
ncbi:ninja-family protein AFP3-like [Iris pallida]|uniref:Ninja-family protein n=1 Tax=Iris pallida TaxID=29817 RepID=A0AAX6DUU2_IRIPA|nr:ninja-family protein AFP3-like [Iris pallida]